MGVSIAMGVPIAGWFVRKNPIYKWMRTGGTPISGNHHIPMNQDLDFNAVCETHD